MRTYSAALFGLLVACPRTSAHTGDGDWTEIPSSQRVTMTAVVDSFMRGMRRADTMSAAQYVTNYEVVRAAWTQYLRDSLDFTGKVPTRLVASNWISAAADTAAIVLEVPHRSLPYDLLSQYHRWGSDDVSVSSARQQVANCGVFGPFLLSNGVGQPQLRLIVWVIVRHDSRNNGLEHYGGG